MTTNAILLCNNYHGAYAPKYIAERIDNYFGLNDTYAHFLIDEILKGVDYAFYWDCFDDLKQYPIFTENDLKCFIHMSENGDYWLITENEFEELTDL